MQNIPDLSNEEVQSLIFRIKELEDAKEGLQQRLRKAEEEIQTIQIYLRIPNHKKEEGNFNQNEKSNL